MNGPMEISEPKPKSRVLLNGEFPLDQSDEGEFVVRIGGYPAAVLHSSEDEWNALNEWYHRGTPLGDRILMELTEQV